MSLFRSEIPIATTPEYLKNPIAVWKVSEIFVDLFGPLIWNDSCYFTVRISHFSLVILVLFVIALIGDRKVSFDFRGYSEFVQSIFFKRLP